VFVFIQELVLHAVLKLQGSIIDDEEMLRLFTETQSSIDHQRSMSHELRYLQVYVTLASLFLVIFCIIVSFVCRICLVRKGKFSM